MQIISHAAFRWRLRQVTRRSSIGLSFHSDDATYLEDISFTLVERHQLLQDIKPIQPETSRQVRHARPQHRVREEVGASRDKLALEIPSIHASRRG